MNNATPQWVYDAFDPSFVFMQAVTGLQAGNRDKQDKAVAELRDRWGIKVELPEKLEERE